MYAVIIAGGKQYRVKEGQSIKVDKIELEIGANVEIEQVLMITENDTVKIGAPYLIGSKVSAVVEQHGRNKKIKIIKHKRRKHHSKEMGHRQWYTELKITNIKAA